MDYSKMLKFHKEKNAKATIAVIEVPWDEASRFGIMNTTDEGKIYEFEEKPAVPKNNQASMGIYIFNTKTLIEYLQTDEDDPKSDNDFGKNIIPNLLNNGEKLYSYKFDGYWKDVGTIASLWEANMDLIGEKPILNMSNKDFRIFSKNTARPPQYLGENSKTVNSLICEGSKIYGTVINSIISGGVIVEEGATVKDSVIMNDVKIEKNACIFSSIIDADSIVECNVTVGTENADKNAITVIAANSTVTSDYTVK